jgi:hypothetical protein
VQKVELLVEKEATWQAVQAVKALELLYVPAAQPGQAATADSRKP